jgi:hypothetical protein
MDPEDWEHSAQIRARRDVDEQAQEFKEAPGLV